MFAFASQHHDLLDQEEKISTFGIFARKPTAVSILPGLTPVFRRFIKEVEDLVPKPKQSTSSFFKNSTLFLRAFLHLLHLQQLFQVKVVEKKRLQLILSRRV